jgi:hypothetical protein
MEFMSVNLKYVLAKIRGWKRSALNQNSSKLPLFRSTDFVQHSIKTNQLSRRIANSPEEPALSLSKGTAESSPGRQSWVLYSHRDQSRRACPELVEGDG